MSHLKICDYQVFYWLGPQIIVCTFVHSVSFQMQQKASSNSERQYAILGPYREWISWEIEQLTIFARGNLQGIPTKKNVRLEIYQDGCQQKYFISQSFTVLWLPFFFFFLPTYLVLQAPATNEFAMCFHFSHPFSGTQLFCNTLPSDPKTTGLSKDAKGVCAYKCSERRNGQRWSVDH